MHVGFEKDLSVGTWLKTTNPGRATLGSEGFRKGREGSLSLVSFELLYYC